MLRTPSFHEAHFSLQGMKYQLLTQVRRAESGEMITAILLESDDRSYVEDMLGLCQPILGAMWINDFDPMSKPGAPNPPPAGKLGGWFQQKKDLYDLVARDVLPNGGVLIYHLVDALHEYIARSARPSGQTAPPTDRNGQTRIL